MWRGRALLLHGERPRSRGGRTSFVAVLGLSLRRVGGVGRAAGEGFSLGTGGGLMGVDLRASGWRGGPPAGLRRRGDGPREAAGDRGGPVFGSEAEVRVVRLPRAAAGGPCVGEPEEHSGVRSHGSALQLREMTRR